MNPQTPPLSPQPKNKRSFLQAASFSGPIPPPSLLAAYDDITPGLAGRLVKMAEDEGNHRREQEAKMVAAEIRWGDKQFSEARWGQCSALMITLAALAIGAYTALSGKEVAGSILGVGGIGGIVVAFILGRPTSQTNRDNKSANGPSKKKGPDPKRLA